METGLPLLLAAVVGFGHAFEADHLVAVGNIVSKRQSTVIAVKDGIFWGLGHTSTIFLIGILMIVGKVAIPEVSFTYFEATVGLMLIGLGFFRLFKHFFKKDTALLMEVENNHRLAYAVGLVHGLAGSGAMILLVMTEIKSNMVGILYLLIFGIGSIIGMLVAAGLFSLPLSKKWSASNTFQAGLIVLSSLLCVGYGTFILWENLS